jgi:hypothetical protein
MRVTTTRASTLARIAAAVAALATLAPVATMAQGGPYGPGGPYGGPSGPYYRTQPNLGLAPRPDFPGAKQAKQPTLRQKCVTYAQHNAAETEPGARTAFYESCMHGMNTTAK